MAIIQAPAFIGGDIVEIGKKKVLNVLVFLLCQRENRPMQLMLKTLVVGWNELQIYWHLLYKIMKASW